MSIRLAILWIWKLIDPLFYLCSRLHYIHEENKKKSIFRVRITKYKGKNVILSDGTKICRNDLLIKIHLHNVRLLNEYIKIKNDLNRARLIYKIVLSSMPSLALYVNTHPREEQIKGIIGITTINKAVVPLGFETFRPTNGLYRRVKKVGQLPIFLLTKSSFRNFQKNKLNYLLMSKDKLYQRYGRNLLTNNNQ
ncbi:YkoP family protein [Neobacillus niacini]|uniref:YkoP family protein n=1 Tax=Neobacillus niacini TaxID=86668 RepID=UPI00286500AE|nr:hypothetical protein [Neobacillus niacini]MDR6998446.1 hypothetical protein [Neobacillus niacini]